MAGDPVGFRLDRFLCVDADDLMIAVIGAAPPSVACRPVIKRALIDREILRRLAKIPIPFVPFLERGDMFARLSAFCCRH
jgi:hypothetical protein